MRVGCGVRLLPNSIQQNRPARVGFAFWKLLVGVVSKVTFETTPIHNESEPLPSSGGARFVHQKKGDCMPENELQEDEDLPDLERVALGGGCSSHPEAPAVGVLETRGDRVTVYGAPTQMRPGGDWDD